MPQHDDCRSIRTAQEFLARCFAPNESIAVFLQGRNLARATQRIVQQERVLALRYLGWLAHQNSTGANIYVGANPIRTGSRKRTKESIAAVRHLYVDIDTDGEARFAALRSGTGPIPNIVLSTSPGKYQFIWRVEGFDAARQESTLKMLAISFGGDSACTDCNRVLRLPGFQNCKYNPANPVTVQYLSEGIYSPADFPLDGPISEAMFRTSGNARKKHQGKHTHSEADWAWVSHELANGTDATKLTRALALRRSDKSNPLYYAQRTVDVASARFWLREGVPMEDIVTMLQVRRRFDIPGSICSARAREIALTAQRMIARNKNV